MKVVICGAGQVGFSIAEQLVSEGNEVTVIDSSAEVIRRIGNVVDVRAIVGHAAYPDVLEQAGAADAEVVIACTYTDEVNMTVCEVVDALFEVPTKIARIRGESYLKPEWSDLFSRGHIPIDAVISPEIEVARAILRRFEVPGAFEVIPFAEGRVQAVGVRLPEDCPVLNTPLRQLTELFPNLNVVVSGIIRDDRMIIPSDEDQLQANDAVYFVAESDHVPRAMQLFGRVEKEARRLIIAGGGNVGFAVAQKLEAADAGTKIKIIEANKDRAEMIADHLRYSVVIHGSALERDILSEANVEASEAIVALTNDDKVNILASLLAKQMGCARAITLVNSRTYKPLVDELGIDVIVQPREITVSGILQHVRKGKIRSVYSLHDGAAEVVEAESLATSSLIGRPLRDIALPDGIIIGAIVRGPKVVIPRGHTVIEPRDRVILFARKDQVKLVEKLFAVRLEFF
jgi:trk system potassium uptake protein TrkA